MREYKSKFTQAIKLQDRLMKGKEKEIAELLQKKYAIENELDGVDQKYHHFKNEMEEGRIVDSSYFFGVFDESVANKKNEQLKKLNLEIRYLKMEREKIKKKKEVLLKIDDERKAEFYYELRKKENKQIENTMSAIRQLKKGGQNKNGD